MVQVLRNGIETDKFQPVPAPTNARPVIAIIGRLSGPKGELCYRLLDEVLDLDACQVKVVSGSQVPARFQRFQERVDFVGYVEDVPCPDGAMRSGDRCRSGGDGGPAVRPSAFAIGEAKAIGLVTSRIWTRRWPATSATSAPGSGDRFCRTEGADPRRWPVAPFQTQFVSAFRPNMAWREWSPTWNPSIRMRGRDPAPRDAGHHVSPLHRA
jgi:hypothetical protein